MFRRCFVAGLVGGLLAPLKLLAGSFTKTGTAISPRSAVPQKADGLAAAVETLERLCEDGICRDWLITLNSKLWELQIYCDVVDAPCLQKAELLPQCELLREKGRHGELYARVLQKIAEEVDEYLRDDERRYGLLDPETRYCETCWS